MEHGLSSLSESEHPMLTLVDETAKRRDGDPAKKTIRRFRGLDVYQNAFAAGLRIYELTKRFPGDERYALTDQIRRSSRSVCANIAEAWRKRRYEAAFVSKLSDAETEAAETQVHAEFAFRHDYLSREEFLQIDNAYEKITGQLVKMIDEPEKWLIKNARDRR
jgi:four helix bundle protein